MYGYVYYVIYAFVKFLDEPLVIICLTCHFKASWGGTTRTFIP